MSFVSLILSSLTLCTRHLGYFLMNGKFYQKKMGLVRVLYVLFLYIILGGSC